MKKIALTVFFIIISLTLNGQNSFVSDINNVVQQYVKDITGKTILFKALTMKSAYVGKVPYAMNEDVVIIYPKNKENKVDFTPKEYNVSYEMSFAQGHKVEMVFTLDDSKRIKTKESTNEEILKISGKVLQDDLISITKAIEYGSKKFNNYSDWKFVRIEKNVKDFAFDPYKKGDNISSCIIQGKCQNCDYTDIKVQVNLKNGEIISRYQYKTTD